MNINNVGSGDRTVESPEMKKCNQGLEQKQMNTTVLTRSLCHEEIELDDENLWKGREREVS